MDPLSSLLSQKKSEQAKPPLPSSSSPTGLSNSLFDGALGLTPSRLDVPARQSRVDASSSQGVSSSPRGGNPYPTETVSPTASPAASRQVPRAPVQQETSTPSGNVPTFDDILLGEKVVEQVKSCHLLVQNPFCEVAGRLLITPYRFRFVTPKGSLRKDLEWMRAVKYFDLPMGLVETAKDERSVSQAGLPELKVTLQTKDLRTLIFLVTSEADIRTIHEAMNAFGTPGNPSMLFAFKHLDALRRLEPAAKDRDSGWAVYDPQQEYARMGVETELIPNAQCPWRVSELNRQYSLCASYPSALVLPRRMTDQALRAVAGFRKRGRLPAMSWCGGPQLSYASLWRCSQTTEGLMGQKCPEDQAIVNAIRLGSSQQERDLLVIDLRPRMSAWANKAGGGGFEAYPNCKVVFGGIDNIHCVREAWRSMTAAVNKVVEGEVGSWLKDVAYSSWYDYIGAIMGSMLKIIKEILDFKSNVMVHCSDGWDRTAQATSLVMLCMDPHYRTQVGFVKLVQKEWCSFGHRFRTRCALGEPASQEYSPVFIQWLECVYQLQQQFPQAFEFSSAVLLRLTQELYTNLYGTFLTDNEQERSQKVAPHTLSLWTTLLRPEEAVTWRNPSYVAHDAPIVPSISQANYTVWEAYWFHFHVHGSENQVEEAVTPIGSGVARGTTGPDPFAPMFDFSAPPQHAPVAPAAAEDAVADTKAAPEPSRDDTPSSLFSPEELAPPKQAVASLFADDDDDEDIFAKPKPKP